MKQKVLELLSELPKVEAELSLPEVMQDKQRYRELSAKHKYLSQLRDVFELKERLLRDLNDARELKKTEVDAEILAFLEGEIVSLEPKVAKLDKRVETLLVPPDPNDHKSSIIELRAGAGVGFAAYRLRNLSTRPSVSTIPFSPV